MFPADWLVEQVTVAQAEAANPGIRDERVERNPSAPNRSASTMRSGKP